jgi:hypothetical protein
MKHRTWFRFEILFHDLLRFTEFCYGFTSLPALKIGKNGIMICLLFLELALGAFLTVSFEQHDHFCASNQGHLLHYFGAAKPISALLRLIIYFVITSN